MRDRTLRTPEGGLSVRRSERVLGRLGPRGLVVAAVGALVLALPVTACRRASADPATLTVRRGTFVRRLVLTGEVKASRAVSIVVPKTETMMTQIKWLERDGTPVKVGDRVVECDASPFVSGLEEKRLAMLEARREREREQAAVGTDLADRMFERDRCRTALEKAMLDAAVPEELLSRREFQERQLKAEKARIELDKAADRLEAARTSSDARIAIRRIAAETAEREVRAAEQAIASLVMTAPRDGLFLVRENFMEGRKYRAGDSAFSQLPVAEIPDPSSLMVEAVLVDVDDGLVVAGLPVRCTLDAFPEKSYPGKVLAVSLVAQEPVGGSQRRAFRVDVGLASLDVERMRAGMSAKVDVEVERLPDVLVAPRVGLEIGPDTARASLANGRMVAVKVGPCSAQECVVREGLVEGATLARAPRDES